MPNADRDAIYARVSGEKQEKEDTIETQLFHLRVRQKAADKPCHAEYLDNPYSGVYLSRRALTGSWLTQWPAFSTACSSTTPTGYPVVRSGTGPS